MSKGEGGGEAGVRSGERKLDCRGWIQETMASVQDNWDSLPLDSEVQGNQDKYPS